MFYQFCKQEKPCSNGTLGSDVELTPVVHGVDSTAQ